MFVTVEHSSVLRKISSGQRKIETIRKRRIVVNFAGEKKFWKEPVEKKKVCGASSNGGDGGPGRGSGPERQEFRERFWPPPVRRQSKFGWLLATCAFTGKIFFQSAYFRGRAFSVSLKPCIGPVGSPLFHRSLLEIHPLPKFSSDAFFYERLQIPMGRSLTFFAVF